MLKNKDGELSPKVKSTLIYLQSLLEEGEELTISVKPAKILVACKDDDLVSPITLQVEEGINPLASLIEHVNDEMCTDCLTQDWLFKHSYFYSLAKSYIETLVHQYGTNIPVSYELARAIVVHDCTDHEVLARNKDRPNDLLVITKEANEAYLEHLKKEGWSFYLNGKGLKQ